MNASNQPAQIVAAIPILPASDVALAVQHYVEKLGFQKEFAHGEPPEYAGLSRDGICVHLCRTNDATAIAMQTMLRFEVQNIEALYEEIRSRGEIHPNGALQTKPWGTREFAVIDRDGVCISFFERVEINEPEA